MTNSAPASLHSSWLAHVSNNPSANEALGLVGVAVCGGAWVRVFIRAIFKDRATADRSNKPNRQRWQELRHVTPGFRAITEQHFVNRPAMALAAAGTENFDRGRTHG